MNNYIIGTEVCFMAILDGCESKFKTPQPEDMTCPKCGSSSIRYGAVGTQRIVEELKKIM